MNSHCHVEVRPVTPTYDSVRDRRIRLLTARQRDSGQSLAKAVSFRPLATRYFHAFVRRCQNSSHQHAAIADLDDYGSSAPAGAAYPNPCAMDRAPRFSASTTLRI